MTEPAPDLFAQAGIDMPAQPVLKRRGRPRLPEAERLETVAVRLNVAQVARVKSFGNGNVTEGLRKLVRAGLSNPAQRIADALAELDEGQTARLEGMIHGKKLPAPGGVDFDGETYDPLRDYDRLNRQMRDVWDVLTDQPGRWWALPEIADHMTYKTSHYHTTQAISARLRDLRKPKYGRWDVERKPSGKRGLWLYRLEPKSYAIRVAQYQESLAPKTHPTGAGTALPLPGFEPYVEGD